VVLGLAEVALVESELVVSHRLQLRLFLIFSLFGLGELLFVYVEEQAALKQIGFQLGAFVALEFWVAGLGRQLLVYLKSD
jgi:hypothetical protein